MGPFSEEDARRIFARAAERQGAGDAPAEGLSLDELKAIGEASGIDPAHVAAAAAELRAGAAAPAPRRFLGVPSSIRATRMLPVPLSDEAWEVLVEDLRDTFRQTGVATEIGRTREWTASQQAGRDGVRVTARPVPGGTELVAEHSLRVNVQSIRVVMACFAALTAVLTVVGLLAGTPQAWAFGPMVGAILALSVGIPVWLLRAQARHSERAFGPLLDRAELAARTTAEPDRSAERSRPVGQDPVSGPSPRLDLPEPDAARAEARRRTRRRTR